MDEEFLKDDDSLPDLNQEDEDALLQDDDILDLIPEEDFNETLDDSTSSVPTPELKLRRQTKFITERNSFESPRNNNINASKPKKANNKQNTQLFKKPPQNYRFNQKQQLQNNTLFINPKLPRVINSQDYNPCIWTATQKPQVLVRPLMALASNLNNQNFTNSTNFHGQQLQSYFSTPLFSQPPIQVNPWAVPGQIPNVQFLRPNNYQSTPIYPNPQFSTASVSIFGQPTKVGTPAISQPNNVTTRLGPIQPNQRIAHHNQKGNTWNNWKKPYNRRRNNHLGKANGKINKNGYTWVMHQPPPLPPSLAAAASFKLEQSNLVEKEKIKTHEDIETRKLLEKIEEQKKQRKALLNWKECRRKVAHAEEIQPKVKFSLPTKQLQQSIQQLHGQHQPIVKHVNQQYNNNIVLTNGYSDQVTKYQKPIAITLPVINSKKMATAPVVNDNDVALDKKSISHFLADRKVMPKVDNKPPPPLIDTRKVVISNISTNTGNKELIRICKVFGDVQNLQRDNNKNQATVIFQTVASAHAFFKKYQRHMLDLSIIETTLSPMIESE